METITDVLWVAVSGALVFFMQPGFQMVESGLTREKNSINVAIKNLTDIGISLFIYWLIGFSFMFGSSHSGILGHGLFVPGRISNIEFKFAAFLFFQAMFCSTSATIVSGAVAERMRYSSYIIETILISAIIYPVFGHWAWGGIQPGFVSDGQGWLNKIGFVDFAGSTVVHSVGGYVGLAGIIILGARKGRFPEKGKPREIQGSDIPMAVAGVFILWFGWLGFNGGSTLAFNDIVPQILVNTSIGAATGMLASLAVGWFITKLPNVNFVINGTLAGLVAITANCHCVTPGAAAIIGAVGGIVMLIACKVLDLLKLDDAVGAIPVHLCAGIWGTLATGIFGQPELLGTTPILGSQFLAQFIGVVACGIWTFGVSFISLYILNKIKRLRVTDEEEDKGLNIAEHGASTEIFELYDRMEKQAQTGDFSVRLPVEPFTEIGQISGLYNHVMDKLESTALTSESIGSLMREVDYPIFMIDFEWNISPQYSALVPSILGCPNPEKYNFLLLMARILNRDQTIALQTYLGRLFDSSFKDIDSKGLNPIENLSINFRKRTDNTLVKKTYSFKFSRIYNTNHTKILHAVVKVVEL